LDAASARNYLKEAALKIDLERGVEGELKGLILYLTPWVLTSGASSSRSHPHEY
jgi:hypothetical protein